MSQKRVKTLNETTRSTYVMWPPFVSFSQSQNIIQSLSAWLDGVDIASMKTDITALLSVIKTYRDLHLHCVQIRG